MKLNMFSLISAFWRMAEMEKFSPSETALYFFLLQKANQQKWQMPVRCSTESIRVYIESSKQNIVKARDGLKRRGLIDFLPGKGKGAYPVYVLKPPESNPLYSEMPKEMSIPLSVGLSPYKKEDKDKDSITINASESSLNLEHMENQLLTEKQWQENLISLISGTGETTHIDNAELTNQIRKFFLYLKTSGIEKRDERECRQHFVNWLSKTFTDKRRNNKDVTNDKSKPVVGEAGTSSPATYYDLF